ncbi:MAG: zinc ribbon domain-containing protein [Promethearchaeota archaeon]
MEPVIDKPPIILADWDEEKGPIVVKSLFKEDSVTIEDSPEVLVSRCFISAQSIFARDPFRKINFSLPMVPIKKQAFVFFDVIEDADVRGGKRPFLLIIFVPIDTKHGMMDVVADFVEPYIVEYKSGRIPNLQELQDGILDILKAQDNPMILSVEPVDISGSKPSERELVQQALKKKREIIYSCPHCGNDIYPDEVSCTVCRFIIRCYCTSCNNLIDRNKRYCPKCGMPNQKYDPSIKLQAKNGLTTFQVEDQVVNTHEIFYKKEVNVLPADLDEDFDYKSQIIAKEIEDIKKNLEAGIKKEKPNLEDVKNKLVDDFTLNYEGFKRGSKDLSAQSLFETFREPVTDEAHLIIKSMGNISSKDLQGQKQKRGRLPYWDCLAYLKSRNKKDPVHIGFRSGQDLVQGIPGTLFILEKQIIFISYNWIYGEINKIFSYFNGALDLIHEIHFNTEIETNYLTFINHGILKKMFPSTKFLEFHFTWSKEPHAGSPETQSVQISALLQRLIVYDSEVAKKPGSFAFLLNVEPSDDSIRAILYDLKIFFPHIARIVKSKYPMLYTG